MISENGAKVKIPSEIKWILKSLVYVLVCRNLWIWHEFSNPIVLNSIFVLLELGRALWNRNIFEFKFEDTRLSSYHKKIRPIKIFILQGKSDIIKFEFKTTLVS